MRVLIYTLLLLAVPMGAWARGGHGGGGSHCGGAHFSGGGFRSSGGGFHASSGGMHTSSSASFRPAFRTTSMPTFSRPVSRTWSSQASQGRFNGARYGSTPYTRTYSQAPVVSGNNSYGNRRGCGNRSTSYRNGYGYGSSYGYGYSPYSYGYGYSPYSYGYGYSSPYYNGYYSSGYYPSYSSGYADQGYYSTPSPGYVSPQDSQPADDQPQPPAVIDYGGRYPKIIHSPGVHYTPEPSESPAPPLTEPATP